MYKYLSRGMSKGFVSLLTGRIFEFVALGMFNLFLPIYLLTQFEYKIEYVFLYYMVGYALYGLLLPLGVQYLNIIGLNNAFRTSIFLYGTYLAAVFYISVNPPLMISISVILIVLARLFFWLPFHVDFAEYTNKKDRGKEYSIMWGARTLTGVIIPVISGFLIQHYGFNLVFLIGIIVYVSAFIPYLRLPRTEEKFSWGVRETFGMFFNGQNRSLILANMANGAEGVVSVVIWPIFIWQLLKGNYFEVGAVSSLIVLITVLLQLTVGKYTDIFNKRKLLHFGSIFYASGWMAKIFVLTAGQIFIVGTYHSLAAIFKDTPFDSLVYEMMADKGHFVDEYTAIKEIAVQTGKVLMLSFVILVSINYGLNWTFALAALSSLFINIL